MSRVVLLLSERLIFSCVAVSVTGERADVVPDPPLQRIAHRSDSEIAAQAAGSLQPGKLQGLSEGSKFTFGPQSQDDRTGYGVTEKNKSYGGAEVVDRSARAQPGGE
jgi:hypothetical protein